MELISIVAGTRPSAGVLIGAMGMMLNLEAIFAMCWVGFMVAVSIKVGHHIGAGEAHRAKRFSILGTGVACARALAVAGGLTCARVRVRRRVASRTATRAATSRGSGAGGAEWRQSA